MRFKVTVQKVMWSKIHEAIIEAKDENIAYDLAEATEHGDLSQIIDSEMVVIDVDEIKETS